MSPMFLGGLTARAMRLNSQTKEIKFIETYPGYLIRNVLELKPHYSKRKTYDPAIEHHLASKYNLVLKEPLGNWHQLDALACWVSGYRFFHNKAIKFGDESEGQIII